MIQVLEMHHGALNLGLVELYIASEAKKWHIYPTNHGWYQHTSFQRLDDQQWKKCDLLRFTSSANLVAHR